MEVSFCSSLLLWYVSGQNEVSERFTDKVY